jgi:Kef-type K+ transport system membrane component KefB
MEFFNQSAFAQMSSLLVLATLVGSIGALLRQPLIVSLVVAGLLAGPSALA